MPSRRSYGGHGRIDETLHAKEKVDESRGGARGRNPRKNLMEDQRSKNYPASPNLGRVRRIMDELKRQVDTEMETPPPNPKPNPKPVPAVAAADEPLNELDSPPPPSSPPPYPQTVATFPTPTPITSPDRTGANPRITDDDHPPVIVGFAPAWKYRASELKIGGK